MDAPFRFRLPEELSAKEPPERRGLARDQVRLLVINRITRELVHSRFDQIAAFLRSGDLLVFNSSRTLPASLHGCGARHGPCMEVRLAERMPDGTWLALLLCEGGDPFSCGLRAGMQIDFAESLSATVVARDTAIPRLWKLEFSRKDGELVDLIYRIGRPVRYEYVSAPWELDYYQTVYAKEPGSAEMPSAGRAFTWKLLLDLKRKGIETAYIVLHTGLSSYMDDELDRQHPASEEEFFIGETAARKINATSSTRGRVIAVGTTVVRALESGADQAGAVRPVHSYTRLHIDAGYELRVVDGLLTGMHEPEASHLNLLSAFLPPDEIHRAYEEAVQRKYLWHEFGDLNLII